MTKVRLSGAFVTRWYEEFSLAADTACRPPWSKFVEPDPTLGEQHRTLELFLEQFGPEIARVLKHQLLEALLADAAATDQAMAAHSETLGDA